MGSKGTYAVRLDSRVHLQCTMCSSIDSKVLYISQHIRGTNQ